MVTEEGLARMVSEIGDRPFALNVTSWSVAARGKEMEERGAPARPDVPVSAWG
jgi:hypothetical protein